MLRLLPADSLHQRHALRRKPLRLATVLAAAMHGPSRSGGLAGAGRLVRGDELMRLRADQVAAAGLPSTSIRSVTSGLKPICRA